MDEKAKVTAGVDYWEFTLPYDRGWDVLSAFPGGREVRYKKDGRSVGWRGYTHSAKVAQGKGLVGWSSGDRRMGVHFSLGSEALSVLAALDERWRDLPSVMAVILEGLGGHTTRLDLAWDDRCGLLDMDEIGAAYDERRYVSKWRNSHRYGSRKPVAGHGELDGETFYFGSGKSDSQLRIYDKRVERLQKGKDVDGDHWIRVELQLRRKRSDQAARLYMTVKENCEAVMTRLAGHLRSMLEFKAPSTDSNKQRQPAASWWVRFLGYAEKAALAVVEAEARTVDDLKRWVSVQVAPTLAVLQEALGFGEAWGFLYAEAQAGRERLKPRHRAILAASV